MNWRIMAVICLAAAVVCATGSSASTALLTLSPGYNIQPVNWFPGYGPWQYGTELVIVGRVQAFAAPMDDLHPGSDPVEYTFALRAPEWYTGLWDDFEHNEGGWIGWSYEASLRVYRDPARNATVGDATSFEDGELILEATSPRLEIVGGGCMGDESAALSFVGGSLLSRISPDASPTAAYTTGTFRSRTCPGCTADWPGQVGCLQSDVVLGEQPVAARHTTWGQLKALYR